MKYGIVGNRTGWDNHFVIAKIEDIIFNEKGDEMTEVTIISGGASGVDSYAKLYAMANAIHYIEFLPDTKEIVPKRYFIRNHQIADACDVLIAFDTKKGISGTGNTMRYAKAMGKEVILITEEKEMCLHCMDTGMTQPAYLEGDWEECKHC